MRIGVVRRGFSRTGGAEAYLLRFAEGLAAAGHEVTLLTEAWPAKEWPYAIVTVNSRSPKSFADALRNSVGEGEWDFLFSLERLWNCDAYRAGDGVHAAWLERRAKFEPAWKTWLYRLNPKHQELLAVEKHLFGPHGAKLVIANSQMIKREIERFFGYATEKIRVVRNGVPPFAEPSQPRARLRAELGLAEGDYALLFAGSGWERKGLRYAIDALNAAGRPHWKLLVAGKGNPGRQPKSPAVRYLGPVKDMPGALRAADAFLLPTIYEPFSNACLEALSAGLPVITTVHNGFSEIVESGVEADIVEDPSDVDALCAAIGNWEDPQRRTSVKPRLQELASRFNIEENVKQTLAILGGAGWSDGVME